jgi:group I intron endonuclease
MYHIYRITNNLNHKAYIGYTIENPPKKRYRAHIYLARKGSTSHIHRAIRKDGITNFSFEVLCWGEDHKAGLEIAEPLMIELFPHEYNMTKGGEGILGYKHTPEQNLAKSARSKISSLGNKNCLGKKNALGTKRTPEQCLEMSILRMGHKGCQHTEESLMKIRAARAKQIVWNKGIKTGPQSPEHIAKRRGRIPWNKGLSGDVRVKHSESTKKKMLGRIPWNKGAGVVC